MKYFILIISIFIFSCTQQTADLLSNNAEITFTVPAGKFSNPITSAIKFKGNLAIKAYYAINGIKAAGELATVYIITDSLKVTTYHTVSGTGSMFSLNNVGYSYINAGEYLDITITSYSNGFVNGAFTGKVSKMVSLNPLVLEPVTITGEIKNAKLSYL